VGTTVKWTNKDNVPHTVTSATGDWDSGQLSNGQSFSHTFTQAGTFAYQCTVHPTMKGTITVTP
jgi:plastocyanin